MSSQPFSACCRMFTRLFGNHYAAALVATYSLTTAFIQLFLVLLMVASNRAGGLAHAVYMPTAVYLTLYVTVYFGRLVASFFLFRGAKRRWLLETVLFLVVLLINLLFNGLVLLFIFISLSANRSSSNGGETIAPLKYRLISAAHGLPTINQNSTQNGYNIFQLVRSSNASVFSHREAAKLLEDGVGDYLLLWRDDTNGGDDVQSRLIRGQRKVHALYLSSITIIDLFCLLCVSMFVHGMRQGTYRPKRDRRDDDLKSVNSISLNTHDTDDDDG